MWEPVLSMFGHTIGIWGCVPVIWGVLGIRELWGHVNVIWDHVIDAVGV